MPKKSKPTRDPKGKFRTRKSPEEELAEWFRRENDRTQEEGVREWETSKDTESKQK